ncbi:MAG: FAD-dependent oxidoreductase [Clostridia bacterium]|nr:FAD-dependent oxidoreductase [Clostridia bacterium]
MRDLDTIYDTIIIGGGPAGLTAALYLARAQKKVLMLEFSGLGGQIATAGKVENYPSVKSVRGIELADNMVSQVLDCGVQIEFERAIRVVDGTIKRVITDEGEYCSKYVVIASGVKNRPLGANEQDFVGKGVSYCAVCDGAFFKDRDVAVIGGGNTAVEQALYLADLCKNVYVIHRRKDFRTNEFSLKKAEATPNIRILTPYTVEKIEGEDAVEGLLLKNTLSDERKNLRVDAVFIAIGKLPQNAIVDDLVELKDGYIRTDDSCQTERAGIYAVGDCRVKKYRQLTTAVADGTVCALSIIAQLNASR